MSSSSFADRSSIVRVQSLLWICFVLLLASGYFLNSSLIYKVLSLFLLCAAVSLQFKFHSLKVNSRGVNSGNPAHDFGIAASLRSSQITFETAPLGSVIESEPASAGSNKGSADTEFSSSVQNILNVLKDFYGADNSAVFWYNKAANKFKLLTASSGSDDTYIERFDAGDDSVSRTCTAKKSVLVNLSKETGSENSGLSLYKNPQKNRSIIATPVIIDEEAIAVVLCDSKTENFFGAPNVETLNVFSESIAYCIKYFTVSEEYAKLLSESNKERHKKKAVNVFDEAAGLFNKEFFESRLSSEINKLKVFNDRTVFCILCGMDNLNSLEESGFRFEELEKVFLSELREQMNGYDMIFKLGDNKYSVIGSFGSEENVFLEYETIRKNISSKIHELEGRDMSFTVSFVIKRIHDPAAQMEQYVQELDRMFELSVKEGGNLVKIG